jgi:hypothetical protein
VNFRALPTQLHAIAEEVVRFLREDRGLSKFKVESPVADDTNYRPTLQTTTPEHQDVWIEVSEAPYLTSLDSVVLHCVTNCLPVKLYVAFPGGLPVTAYKSKIDEARTKGVGGLEISQGKCHVIHEARLLSLTGVRWEDRKRFPVRYRSVLAQAETTFKDGDPAKGCALVYDEIEALSRKLTAKVVAKGWLRAGGVWPAALKIEKDAWAIVMDRLIELVDFGKLPKDLKKSLLIRVAAMTDPRNDSGHKPKNRKAHVKRDRQLRTRFESAVDLFADLVDAARPLRL